jgi:tetratricopeptide (TPR) repeat protein
VVTAEPTDTRLLSGALAILGRHRPGSPGAPLDRALAEIEQTLADPEFAAWDQDTKAYVWLLAGAAATFRSRTDRSSPDDLDRAVGWLKLAGEAASDGSIDAHMARVNLAAALVDRYERDKDSSDVEWGLRLLPPALDGLRAAGAPLHVGLHLLGLAKYARWEVGRDPGDLAGAINAYRDAIASPRADSEQRAGYLNSLGFALQASGQMTEASDTYDQARGLVAWPSVARRDSTINIAAMLLSGYRDRAEPALLAACLDLYEEAYEQLKATRTRQFGTVADNLGVALVHQYRLTGQVDHLQRAAALFEEAAGVHPTGSREWVTAISGFALVLTETYDRTARITMLDYAITMYEWLVDQPMTRTAERCQGLGVCLVKRFVHADSRFDLERGLRLLGEAASGMTVPADRAAALNSEANAWELRFVETHDPSDSDRATALVEEAVAGTPPGSTDAAIFRCNLGNMLLRRFEILGERAALDRAVAVQRAALAGVRAHSAPPAVALAALADSLAARAIADPSDTAVREATAAFRDAVEANRQSVPAQALAAAERWGRWAAARSAWAEAVEAYEHGLHALRAVVSTQEGRRHKETWLWQARTVPVDGAVAMLRAGATRRAVTALEQGRAVLLSESLPPAAPAQ